jgi:scyllo-inositol 2-dehydrogenase (NADP+)
MSLSVGVVGFGLAGRQFHCPLITAAGMQVRGVVTRQAELVRQSLGDVRVHAEIDSLLADPAIDLVVIATPNHLHAPQALAALKAGKHVVIDKPFALNLYEVDELLRTAQEQRRCLAVFHNRRWDSDFLTLRKVLEAGRLGDIYRVQIRWDRFRPNVVERWREHEEAGGGLLLDLGPHLIDQALCLFGTPEWVQAELLKQRTGATVEDGFEIWMGKGSLRIHIGCSAIAPDNIGRYQVHGLLGSLSKGGLDVQEPQLREGMNPLSSGFGIEPDEQSALLVDANGHRERLLTERGNWVEFYRGMQRAIEAGALVPMSGAEAREVMRVMDAVRTSHLEQRRIGL